MTLSFAPNRNHPSIVLSITSDDLDGANDSLLRIMTLSRLYQLETRLFLVSNEKGHVTVQDNKQHGCLFARSQFGVRALQAIQI